MKLKEIDLFVTERCNLDCDFCSVDANNSRGDLISTDRIKELIKEGVALGLEELHLTGGEPILRRDIADIISFATQNKLSVRLITNGTLVDECKLKEMKDAGLKSIMLSLDGLAPYHDRSRGNGAFEKTVATILLAKKLQMFTRVNSVGWSDNRNDIYLLATFLADMNVDVFSVFLGSPLGRGKNRLKVVCDVDEWKELGLSLKKIILNHNIKMSIIIEKGFIASESAPSLDGMIGCGLGCSRMPNNYDYFLIRGNGEIFPCVFFSNEGEAIGNILKHSLYEVLSTFKDNNFYNKLSLLPIECQECEARALCKGGCRGYAKLLSDNWFTKDPRCNIKKNSYYPACPIMKENLLNGNLGGSSEQALGKL